MDLTTRAASDRRAQPPEPVMLRSRVRDTNDHRLAEFCREQQPRLLGALTLYTGDRHLAEELTQETLVRVVIHWRTIADLESPAAWAHRVGINLANSSFRRAVARGKAMARLAGRREEAPPTDTPTALALRDAVAALPERQRAALVLRYYSDLGTRDVATMMQCAEGTVSALVHQALASLRRRSGFESLEVPDA